MGGKIKISNGVSVIGIKSITRSGSYERFHIPHISILVEDKLASCVIDLIRGHSFDFSSPNYIYTGVWANQLSCLYGFLSHGEAMMLSLNIPGLSVFSVSDGDVSRGSLEKRIKSVVKGDDIPSDKMRERLKALATSFWLEYLPASISGLPEYNHKKWFEEISKEVLYEAHISDLSGPCTTTRTITKLEIDGLLEVIEYSKSLEDKDFIELYKSKKKDGNFELDKNGEVVIKSRVNYHSWYGKMQCFTPTNHINLNLIEHYVLENIKKYNPRKWEGYTKDVRALYISLSRENNNNFGDKHLDELVP